MSRSREAEVLPSVFRDLQISLSQGVPMERITKTLLLSATFFTLTALSNSASAALFDTLESVDTLTTIAAKKTQTDRMPAGKVTESVEVPATTDTPAPSEASY